MSAVDAPPGIAFAGTAAGEFVANKRARRLARLVFYYTFAVGLATWTLAWRNRGHPGIEVLLSAPVLFIGIGTLGYAVRAARLRVDVAGVRWGWSFYGFRMSGERITRARVYRDAVALSSRRGSTWYLARRDWRHFDNVGRALKRAGIPFERIARRAPLRARLQAFGLALDLLLVANVAGATFAMAVAFAL